MADTHMEDLGSFKLDETDQDYLQAEAYDIIRTIRDPEFP